MDPQDLLDQLLQSGKKLAEQGLEQGTELAARGKDLALEGTEFARQKFRLPDDGGERDKMLGHLGAGAAAGGILALLLGTSGGRRTLSRVAKVGSLAGLGVLGYKIYSDYQKENGEPVELDANDHLTGPTGNSRCLMIVQAMIAAAKADGIIDDRERKAIEDRIRQSELDSSAIDTLLEEIAKPLIVSEVASLAKTPIDGVDVYLASLLVIEAANDSERKYLNDLAQSLDLDHVLINRLETEAFKPI